MDIIQFQKNLDMMSSWRKKELSVARSLAKDKRNNAVQKYLYRAWVLMMYAHCDNFLKEAGKEYIRYIRENNITNYDHNLLWLIIKGKEVITNGKSENYKSIFDLTQEKQDFFFDIILSDSVFEKRSFQYKSLRFFCDWVFQINFDYNHFEPFCVLLTNKRNEIAHGEESYIDDTTACNEWHNKTITFIDSLKDSLILHAQSSNKPSGSNAK